MLYDPRYHIQFYILRCGSCWWKQIGFLELETSNQVQFSLEIADSVLDCEVVIRYAAAAGGRLTGNRISRMQKLCRLLAPLVRPNIKSHCQVHQILKLQLFQI